ncbi:MAG: methyltransferase domain-containing protein [Alphaproteobacteria bacterium]|nr:methyltransferase domain-containing protein [Alphaproteobacteria bacterium]
MDLEKMDDFFTKRINSYEDQMLNNVEGCREGYKKIADFIPKHCKNLLDLGCGTGLELKYVFKRFPNMLVTGIDYTKIMLDKLYENYPKKNIDLICGDYFKVAFGTEKYDCVISFQTMHHFTHEAKISLYKKVRNALKNYGCYIECDYVAKDLTEENFFFTEAKKIREEKNISPDILIHYDTPCCSETQIKLLSAAGFSVYRKLWKLGQTAIFKAEK